VKHEMGSGASRPLELRLAECAQMPPATAKALLGYMIGFKCGRLWPELAINPRVKATYLPVGKMARAQEPGAERVLR